ncbi:hypothetical protein V1517DRAFT_315025 [Lipomyces orientalis]|uniref:Uncharacterized protein n=1 Tax=Lipomyces orientalis TaxID=1233043 RepID=A0ACC3TWS4_9ASCO
MVNCLVVSTVPRLICASILRVTHAAACPSITPFPPHNNRIQRLPLYYDSNPARCLLFSANGDDYRLRLRLRFPVLNRPRSILAQQTPIIVTQNCRYGS